MKIILLFITVLTFSSFTTTKKSSQTYAQNEAATAYASFSLINDTKEKVSIYTGSGFVSLNKGSKTSISCKIGKEVYWAEKGKKKSVIFKIKSDMCGKTLKLSKLL